MEKTSNEIVDPFHLDQLPRIGFSLDFPEIMGVGNNQISNPRC